MKQKEHEVQKHALLADTWFGDILDKAEPTPAWKVTNGGTGGTEASTEG